MKLYYLANNIGKWLREWITLFHSSVIFDIQLLTRVFDIMRAKNPEMVTGEKKKFVMKPPQVVRIGTKKTSFANFTDICKMYVDESLRLL